MQPVNPVHGGMSLIQSGVLVKFCRHLQLQSITLQSHA